MLTVLDLFSGIGGFSLGLERAGMRTVAFCESDPYCRRVLAKHWPDVPIFPDVKTLRGSDLAQPVDVVCGGFPCQDISTAGRGAGIDGSRSGLWREFARIVGEVRPRYVFVENVSALLGRGLGRVLGDLAALGYDSEWHCIPASAVGASHRRDRVWIVAYDNGQGQHAGAVDAEVASLSEGMADAHGPRLEERREPQLLGQCATIERNGTEMADASRQLLDRPRYFRQGWRSEFTDGHWWESEPDVGRVADGVPHRVDRLQALGNALMPQIAEIIGRAVLA